MDQDPGPDQIHPRTVLEAREKNAGTPAEIYKSLDMGDVQEDWRVANVASI